MKVVDLNVLLYTVNRDGSSSYLTSKVAEA